MAATEVQCKVTGFKMLTPTVFEILFEPEPQVEFKAGQFVSIVIPGAGPNGRDLRRAYSIASEPKARPVELCVKLVEDGPGTNYLYKLRPGVNFRGFAPYGDFLFEPKPGKNACFISTGTGIAPFRSMIFSQEFDQQPPPKAWALLGVREENELLYEDEMIARAKKGGTELHWVPCVSRPKGEGPFFRGRVTDWFRAQGEDFPWLNTDYYLCGGSAMIDEIKKILADRGVDKESIHQEIYYRDPKPT